MTESIDTAANTTGAARKKTKIATTKTIISSWPKQTKKSTVKQEPRTSMQRHSSPIDSVIVIGDSPPSILSEYTLLIYYPLTKH